MLGTNSSQQSPTIQIACDERAKFSIAAQNFRCALGRFAGPATACGHSSRLKKYSLDCIFLLHADANLVFFNCELVKNSRYVDNERA
jgi:hypothetical protein